MVLEIFSSVPVKSEISFHYVVPDREEGSEGAIVIRVVVVMEKPSTGHGNHPGGRPRELKAGVSLRGGEHSPEDPKEHGEEVDFASEDLKADGGGDDIAEEILGDIGVLGRDREGADVFVVLFVDQFVERGCVEDVVAPVEEEIFGDLGDQDMEQELARAGEGGTVHFDFDANLSFDSD